MLELERRSARQLRLKAAEMLRSSTQLVKSHGDDLCLEYVWNGDEYGSLENSVKTMEKTLNIGGRPEILAIVHVIERPITVHYEDSDKGTVSGEFFTDCSCTDIHLSIISSLFDPSWGTTLSPLIISSFFSSP